MSGTSQMRNCGESTFPNATKAATALADAVRSSAGPRRVRAKTIQTEATARAPSTVWTEASVSGRAPIRFCEPELVATDAL
jgi:hypothetical protein